MSNRRRMPVKQAAPMSMEERMAEKDRILNEEKKRREHAERLQFDSNFRDAQEKLNQEREKAENEKRRMETERANNDEAARRKQKQDEERNAREEEERKKRVEIELQKKLEDDRKRAEERRKKIEEDRRKRQDEERKQMEERRRIQEEETRRLEMENAELAMRAANNDFSFLTSHQQQEQPTYNLAEEIDLLGGGSEDGGSSKSGSEYEGSEYSYDGYSEGSRGQLTTHRLAPQRGTIDEQTDNYLDRLDCPAVSIKKHGKQDGSYIFGQKMMRVQIDRGTRELKVNVSNKLMSIQEFIDKFERVEVLREKGLKSALLITSMLNQPKSNLDLSMIS